MDLIDRQDAIDALSMMQGIVAENGVRKGISMAWQQIKDLPTANVIEAPGWIPVSERLPEYGQRVLVTYDLVKKYPWVNILRYGKPMSEDKPCFYEAGSEWGDVPYDGIVAWMPLPKPYREGAKNAQLD